jgi:hypothetical protein
MDGILVQVARMTIARNAENEYTPSSYSNTVPAELIPSALDIQSASARTMVNNVQDYFSKFKDGCR